MKHQVRPVSQVCVHHIKRCHEDQRKFPSTRVHRERRKSSSRKCSEHPGHQFPSSPHLVFTSFYRKKDVTLLMFLGTSVSTPNCHLHSFELDFHVNTLH